MSEGAFFLDEEPHSVARPLFGLQAAGTGGERESLSSYLKRLAHAHRMPMREFALNNFSLEGSRGLSLEMRSDWGRRLSERLDGVNDRAGEIADWLQLNTGVPDLRLCTLTSLSRFFCGQKLIARHQRICLDCLADDRRAGRPMFERLLWRLQPVTCCDKHRCALVAPKCEVQRPRGRLAPPNLPGVCPHCGAVGMACSAEEVPRECSEGEFWVAEQCRRLIEAMASLVDLNPVRMKESLRAHLREGPGIIAAGEEVGMVRSSMSAWLSTPASKLMMSRFMDIALTRQLDPIELLRGHVVAVNGPADRRALSPKRMLPSVDHAAVEARLRRALELGEDAACVARDLKVSHCSLGQHRELYRQVVDQARASRMRQDTDRRHRAVAEAEQMITKLLGQQKTPSLLNAKTESGKTWMPSSLKAEALACIRVRLGHSGVQLPSRAPLYSAELKRMLDESAERIRKQFL